MKLSVVLPHYNHGHCVAAQLSAILEQSFADFELIVLDDASTDCSVEVIEKAIAGDPRARLVRNPANLGTLANVERGRGLAAGKYLIFPAADDKIAPDSFRHSIEALERYPQAGICLSLCTVDPGGGGDGDDEDELVGSGPVRLEAPAWSNETRYFTPAQVAERVGGCCISGINVYRADAYAAAVPPLDVMRRLAWHADWFMNYAIAFTTGVAYVPETLAVYRIDPNSYSSRNMYHAERQIPVVRTIMELLASPRYRALAPLFDAARAMETIPNPLARL